MQNNENNHEPKHLDSLSGESIDGKNVLAGGVTEMGSGNISGTEMAGGSPELILENSPIGGGDIDVVPFTDVTDPTNHNSGPLPMNNPGPGIKGPMDPL